MEEDEAPHFGTREVCAAFDFSEAHLRRLIQWQALIPTGGRRGRGKVRKLSFGDMTHIGVVSALNRAGLGLQMAHTVAAFLPAEPSRLLFQPDALFSTNSEMYNELYGKEPVDVAKFPKVTVRILDQKLVVWDSYLSDPYAIGELVDEGRLYRLLVVPKIVRSDYANDYDDSSLLLDPVSGAYEEERPDIEETYHAAIDERIVHIDRAIVLGFRRLFNLPIRERIA